MLFQPSNIAPSTLSGLGIGTVDVTQGIDVSWQVNGDSPMTDYQITIYQNDTASTQMYTTSKISLSTPFQTHDAQGNPRFFSTKITAPTLSAAGIVNGYANGYKLIIKQWWSANDSVEQTSASVFITRTTPTLSINAIASPVAASSTTITATYAQAEGDPISTVEWVFAIVGNEDNPIKQTGAVNTQILSFDADGLITGNAYSIMCNVVTANGVEVSTGFVQFSVSYTASPISVNYQLAQLRNSSAVYLTCESLGVGVTGSSIYRYAQGDPVLRHVSEVTGDTVEILDYYVPSQSQVSYLIIAHDSGGDLFLQTSSFTPTFWFYSVLLCDTGSDGFYHVRSEYVFKYGVETGAVSNNNSPTIQTNFTKYPTRQPISSLYKTGSVKGYIGTVSSQKLYSDSVSLQNAIYNISTSTLTKFLKTRKGETLLVECSSPIQMQMGDNMVEQPLVATIDWVEVGDCTEESVISVPTDSFWPL